MPGISMPILWRRRCLAPDHDLQLGSAYTPPRVVTWKRSQSSQSLAFGRLLAFRQAEQGQ